MKRVQIDLECGLVIFENEIDIPIDHPDAQAIVKYFDRVATKNWRRRNHSPVSKKVFDLWINDSNIPNGILQEIARLSVQQPEKIDRKELDNINDINKYLNILKEESDKIDIHSLKEIKELDPEENISITIGGKNMQGKVAIINRALTLYSQNKVVEKTRTTKVYEIKGREPEPYTIEHDLLTDKWTCTCKSYTEAHQNCKHIWACLMAEKPEIAED